LKSPKKRAEFKIVSPRLLDDLPVGNSSDASFVEESEISSLKFLGIDLTNRHAELLTIRGTRFETVLFCGSRLEKLRLTDASFDVCNLSNCNWTKTTAIRVSFADCKFFGFISIGSYFSNILFKNCVVENAQLQDSEFKMVLFDKCNVINTDFQYADLRKTVFRDCDLQGSSFLGAKLNGTDLRGSKLNKLKVGATELKGSIISKDQAYELASSFANLLGIDVREE